MLTKWQKEKAAKILRVSKKDMDVECHNVIDTTNSDYLDLAKTYQLGIIAVGVIEVIDLLEDIKRNTDR